jgi:hypothetical protein
LRHVAYGYDLVHAGLCLTEACEWIFPEPDYDCAAFGRDPERRRVLDVATAEGWAAVVPNPPERVIAGQPVRFEPLQYWALVERQDGSRSMEGLVRDELWRDEPGAAEFLEAWHEPSAILGYASRIDHADPMRLLAWGGLLRARSLDPIAAQGTPLVRPPCSGRRLPVPGGLLTSY